MRVDLSDKPYSWGDPVELYDLDADPGEFHDLAASAGYQDWSRT